VLVEEVVLVQWAMAALGSLPLVSTMEAEAEVEVAEVLFAWLSGSYWALSLVTKRSLLVQEERVAQQALMALLVVLLNSVVCLPMEAAEEQEDKTERARPLVVVEVAELVEVEVPQEIMLLLRHPLLVTV
jgi:hypothetical protein